MTSVNSVCFNCGTVPKYKCPTCRVPYCSLKCYNEHKLLSCTRPIETIKDSSNSGKPMMCYPTDDTLPLETLEKLRYSTGLKECLKNPHVRQIMSMIDKSQNPTDLIAQAMIEPIFVEFATECLKVVQPIDREETYSSDED